MVYYFVMAEDGSRYGPADIDTLVQWTREGRILGHTTLIERGTERTLSADEISAINAELRRMTGSPQVAVERDARPSNEAPTMSSPGGPFHQPFPQNPAAGRVPTAAGSPPPIPTVPGPTPIPYADRIAALRHAASPISSRSKIVAGLLGIFLGQLGIHRFYLGYTGTGLFMLLITVFAGGATGGASCGLIWLWGFIEGVICLCGGMRDVDGLELSN